MAERQQDRKLVLADGQAFYGTGFGADSDALCQLVFNTSMVGYQNIVTDPCCMGLAMVMTYPLIGNYGMTDEDGGLKAQVGALIVRDYNDNPSNFRYTKTLGDSLEEWGVPGLAGVDTRQLTRMIREQGPQPCLITAADTPHEVCMARLAGYTPPGDLAQQVSCKRPWHARTANPRLKVVAVDCGLNNALIRPLGRRGINVTVVPCTATAGEIMAMEPHGLLLSDGPGSPRDLPGLIDRVQALRGRLPIYGVGLGGLIIALSYGADICALPSGHRGDNHPVVCGANGLIEMTTQNHGYTVVRESLTAAGLTETHTSLLDGTVEGVCGETDGAYAVLFQPGSDPGPQGTAGFYDRFVATMEGNHA